MIAVQVQSPDTPDKPLGKSTALLFIDLKTSSHDPVAFVFEDHFHRLPFPGFLVAHSRTRPQAHDHFIVIAAQTICDSFRVIRVFRGLPAIPVTTMPDSESQ